MTLLHPWVLTLFPILYMVRFLIRSKSISKAKISQGDLFSRAPTTLKQKLRPWIIHISFATFFLSLVIAAARPVFISTPSTDSGRNIMLVVDVSLSMQTMDFYDSLYRTSRMNGVKKVVLEFIRSRPSDRFGIVAFGGRAFLQSPLTKDQAFLQDSIEALTFGVAGDGTAMGDAIAVATKRLSKLPSESKAIILVTDGASNAGTIQPLSAAAIAKDLGVKIFSIGIGSNQSDSPFDEETLNKISSDTLGIYRNAQDVSSLRDITKLIDQLLEDEANAHIPKQIIDNGTEFIILSIFSFIIYLLAQIIWFPRKGILISKKKLLVGSSLIIIPSIVALFHPSWGEQEHIDMLSKNFNIFLAIDVSASMLAEDVPSNRLEKAKREALKLVSSADLAQTRIGIILFAGSAYLYAPPTSDISILKSYIQNIAPEMVEDEGSNFTEAITYAKEKLNGEKVNGSVVLISDGEAEKPFQQDAINQGEKSKIKIFTIPIGTKEGIHIKDRSGEFIRDDEGSLVISKVDTDFLSKLANSSGGKVLQSGNDLSLFSITTNENSTQKQVALKNEIGWIFCLLCAVIVISIQAFSSNPILFCYLIFIFLSQTTLCNISSAQDLESYKGYQSYLNNDFKNSSEFFSNAIEDDKSSWQKSQRLADSFFKDNRYNDAINEFENSSKLANTQSQKFDSKYNQGNAYLALNKFDEAISSYDEALKSDAENLYAKTNREIALRKKQEAEQKNSNQNSNDQKNSDKESQNEHKQNKDSSENGNSNKNQDTSKETSDESKKSVDSQKEDNKENQQQKPTSTPEKNYKANDNLNSQEHPSEKWLNSLPDAPLLIQRSTQHKDSSRSNQRW